MFGLESKPFVPWLPPHLLKRRISLISIATMVSIEVFLSLFKFGGGEIDFSLQDFHTFGDPLLILLPFRVLSPSLHYNTQYKPFTVVFYSAILKELSKPCTYLSISSFPLHQGSLIFDC